DTWGETIETPAPRESLPGRRRSRRSAVIAAAALSTTLSATIAFAAANRDDRDVLARMAWDQFLSTLDRLARATIVPASEALSSMPMVEALEALTPAIGSEADRNGASSGFDASTITSAIGSEMHDVVPVEPETMPESMTNEPALSNAPSE